jgi:hypothetical protein
MTMPEAFRKPFEDAMGQLTMFGGGAASLLPVGPGLLPPERAANWQKKAQQTKSIENLPFEELASMGFFRRDELRSEYPEDKLAMLRGQWRAPRLMLSSGRMQMPGMPPADAAIIVLKPNSITVIVTADMIFESQVLYARCYIAVECTAPGVLAAVNAAREKGLDSKNDGTILLRSLPSRGWRIAWLQSDMETRSPMPTSEMPPGR